MDYQDGQGKRRREVIKGAQNRGEALIALQVKVNEIFTGKFSPSRKKSAENLAQIWHTKEENSLPLPVKHLFSVN